MQNKRNMYWKTNQVIYNKYIKKTLDILVSIMLLVLTSPILLIAIIFIKLDSKGPVFFKQKRVGKDCKEFFIYKLRTMDLLTHDINGNKRRDRERITKAGKIIRKLSLDELPQLINIIKVDMSFIGPRPLLCRYLPYYTEEEMKRHAVLPGITGLAQINGRSFLNWEERFAYDIEYVKNISMKTDIDIIIKTVIIVFVGEGTSTVRPKNLVDFDEHRNYEKLR